MTLSAQDLKRLLIKNHVYCDERSIESGTKVIKRKYKIFCNPIDAWDQYAFVITFGQKESTNENHTFIVKESDWEYKVNQFEGRKPYLHGDSYCDVSKIDILTSDQIFYKIREKDNQFLCIAKLCGHHQKEIEAHCVNYYEKIRFKTFPAYIDKVKVHMGAITQLSENVSWEALKKLGLD